MKRGFKGYRVQRYTQIPPLNSYRWILADLMMRKITALFLQLARPFFLLFEFLGNFSNECCWSYFFLVSASLRQQKCHTYNKIQELQTQPHQQ